MSTEPVEPSQEAKGKKAFTGEVVSKKTDKTILVLIETQKQDKRYRKIVKSRKKIMAHDEENTCKEGDIVQIEECKPVSKNKAFTLKKVVKRKVEV
jgi:small subunit ribosomal protein S17